MIDTFQIFKMLVRVPEERKLISKGWKPLFNRFTGKSTVLILNSPKGTGAPRLTLSQNPLKRWIIRAEVSLGNWLYNSNLHLVNADELSQGLRLLSEYVEDNSGIVFDARTARVSRVDFTRDFSVEEDQVIPIIAKIGELTLPKYVRHNFGDTTVYFQNCGKAHTKKFLIYGKYQERINKNKDQSEIEASKGILRLEISLKKKGVSNLAKSLKLPNHQAQHILTAETSQKVIEEAMTKLHFSSLLSAESASVEKLFDLFKPSMAFNLIGFLYTSDKYGKDLSKTSFINISPKTLKRYADDCRKAGISSLERVWKFRKGQPKRLNCFCNEKNNLSV